MRLGKKMLDLEQKLQKLSQRLGTSPQEPFEIYAAILDDVEAHLEPAGRSGRTFPYNQIAVHVAVPPERRAAAEAVFEHVPPMEQRIAVRLREAGCEPPVDLAVTLHFTDVPKPGWDPDRSFAVEYRRQRRRPEAAATAAEPDPPVPGVRLTVERGRARTRSLMRRATRIDIGRMEDVEDAERRVVRRNDLAFLEEDDPVNRTVSRAHAHIRWEASKRDFRLHDDRSTYGTRIRRGGEILEVPARSLGVALRDGDEICLGRARVRFTIVEEEGSEAAG